MGFCSSKLKAIRNRLLIMYGAGIHEKQVRRLVSDVSQKRPVKVVFFAMNVSMWRYQQVYEQLQRDARFRVFLVLSPSVKYARSQQLNDLREMRRFFSQREMEYIDWELEEGKDPIDPRKSIDPDILFYTQQHAGILTPLHEYTRFMDKLLCLIPYGIGPAFAGWLYNTPFHNLAWKLYYPSVMELEDARLIARNKARNVVVSGYSIYDDYCSPTKCDPWKSVEGSRKRIIWAPHFSLGTAVSHYKRSNFLWMADVMIELARKYRDTLQIAFKPHPKLLTELYAHPDWGKERTDAYYRLWQDMPNTQLETGEFIHLFKGSDAMVHDSGSFMVEYLFVDKPALYVTADLGTLRDSVPQLGKSALDAHYIAGDKDEVENFLLRVVIGGNDAMEPERKDFYDRFLKPPHDEGVGEFIYHDICRSLFSE